MSDAAKSFLGLLNGIIRHDYYDELDLTDDLLKQEIYPDLPGPEFTAVANKARNVIKVIIYTFNHLEVYMAPLKKPTRRLFQSNTMAI